MDERKAHYIAVTAIVIKDGKYLIAKRSLEEKVFPGLWTVPGGKIEVDDYKSLPKDTGSHWYNIFENALRREVREEAGIEIDDIRYLTSLAFFRSDGIPVIVVSLFADYAKGEVVLNDELSDFAWVTLEEAKEYEFIEGILEEIEMLDIYLKTGKMPVWGQK
ncbi:MAG: NUDIX domain-containing protein [Candidatus Aenigmarchaeota archaeon]|nr:NUDIX domain-containing protein [Candidatus Aenigmarchaeota archaeon]